MVVKRVDRYYMAENKIFWDIDVAQNVERTLASLFIQLVRNSSLDLLHPDPL